MNLIFSSFLLLINSSFSQTMGLKCSKNNTEIIYVNGVNVKKSSENSNTVKKLKDEVLIKNEIDDNSNVNIEGLWNASRGLFKDTDEILVMLATNHQGKKRADFWKKFAIGKLDEEIRGRGQFYLDVDKDKLYEVIERVTDRRNVTYEKDGKRIDQLSYTEEDYKKDFGNFNEAMFDIIANAKSEVSVVEDMKNMIKEKYKNGENKLIIVSHSQGNEVAFTAIKELRKDSSFLKNKTEIDRFDSFVGYMQVAPPSPRLITGIDQFGNRVPSYVDEDGNIINEDLGVSDRYLNHAQYIRHDRDGIIGLSYFMTKVNPIPANYNSGISFSFDWLFFNDLARFVKVFYENYLKKDHIETLYHGMDDVYLSDTFIATRQAGEKKNAPLREHFRDNMREIASKLESNCDEFDVDVSYKIEGGDALATGNVDTGFKLVRYNPNLSDVNFDFNFPDYKPETDVVSITSSSGGNYSKNRATLRFNSGGLKQVTFHVTRTRDGIVLNDKSVTLNLEIEAVVRFAQLYSMKCDYWQYGSNGQYYSLDGSNRGGSIIISKSLLNEKVTITTTEKVNSAETKQYLQYTCSLQENHDENSYECSMGFRDNIRDFRVTISDYYGVIYQQDIVNPCYQGRIFSGPNPIFYFSADGTEAP